MTVLVTGADGFVGRWLVRALTEAGRPIVAAVRPDRLQATDWARWAARAVREVPFDLDDAASVADAAREPCTAVVHLAAQASGAASLADPGRTWALNAGGTARLCDALARRTDAPRVLIVSSAEVYGQGPPRPRREDDPVAPRSPYAASKLGAELAAEETARRTGLPVIVARPFPHTGPGQDARFVVPAFAQRLARARDAGERTVPVGNLDPVRDLLDVRDVTAAYLALLDRGAPGTTYNVASGRGVSLREVFTRLAALVGVAAEPVTDPGLVRPADVPHLVGDSARLHAATGWAPRRAFDDTLRDLVNAQTD